MESNDLSCEPMDIDLSNQSVRDMDISYNESVTRRTSLEADTSAMAKPSPCNSHSAKPTAIVKKFHINIQTPPRSSKNTLLKIITAFLILSISILTYHVRNLKCYDEFNLEVISDRLSKKLYGQSEAVNLLTKSLELKVDSKILFFCGGTGVGKTFTSSLLLDTIGSCSNVYHYTMSTFKNTFSTDLMIGLTMCKISLVIVDDLTINNMDIVEEINTVIEKSENLRKEITVILIFNCNKDYKTFDNKCDESFKRKLLDNFSKIHVVKRFIEFKPLSETHLKECIKQELGTRKLSLIEFHDVLKNFNVSMDGCKGVHAKMKYLITE